MLRSYGLDLTVSGDCFVNMLIYGGLPQKVHYHLQVGAVLSQIATFTKAYKWVLF